MNYYGINTSKQELHHHGILGMKWGVRRYQNPDGSLTPAGQARYNKTVSAGGIAFYKRQRRMDKHGGHIGSERFEKKMQKKLDKYGYEKAVRKEQTRAKVMKVGAAITGTAVALGTATVGRSFLDSNRVILVNEVASGLLTKFGLSSAFDQAIKSDKFSETLSGLYDKASGYTSKNDKISESLGDLSDTISGYAAHKFGDFVRDNANVSVNGSPIGVWKGSSYPSARLAASTYARDGKTIYDSMTSYKRDYTKQGLGYKKISNEQMARDYAVGTIAAPLATGVATYGLASHAINKNRDKRIAELYRQDQERKKKKK